MLVALLALLALAAVAFAAGALLLAAVCVAADLAVWRWAGGRAAGDVANQRPASLSGQFWGYQIPWAASDVIAYVGVTSQRSPLDRWGDANHPCERWPWALDPRRATVVALPSSDAMFEWERSTILAYAAEGHHLLNRAVNPPWNWAPEPTRDATAPRDQAPPSW